jgi:hypothetical protein
MKLSHPFIISARLLPALTVADCTISFDAGAFIFDFSDGSEYIERNLRPPQCRTVGVNDTPERLLQSQFGDLLAFLSACAESRQYATRTGRTGENADLFPENVGAWAEANSDEIGMLSCEIEETPGLVAP